MTLVTAWRLPASSLPPTLLLANQLICKVASDGRGAPVQRENEQAPKLVIQGSSFTTTAGALLDREECGTLKLQAYGGFWPLFSWSLALASPSLINAGLTSNPP